MKRIFSSIPSFLLITLLVVDPNLANASTIYPIATAAPSLLSSMNTGSLRNQALAEALSVFFGPDKITTSRSIQFAESAQAHSKGKTELPNALKEIHEPSLLATIHAAISRAMSRLGLVTPDLRNRARRDLLENAGNLALHAAMKKEPSVPAAPAPQVLSLDMMGIVHDAHFTLGKMIQFLNSADTWDSTSEDAFVTGLNEVAASRLRVLKSGLKIEGPVAEYEQGVKTYYQVIENQRGASGEQHESVSPDKFDLARMAMEHPVRFFVNRVISNIQKGFEHTRHDMTIEACGVPEKEFFRKIGESVVLATNEMPAVLEPWAVIGSVLEDSMVDLIVKILENIQNTPKSIYPVFKFTTENMPEMLRAQAISRDSTLLMEAMSKSEPQVLRLWDERARTYKKQGVEYSLVRIAVEDLLATKPSAVLLESLVTAVEWDAMSALLNIWQIIRKTLFQSRLIHESVAIAIQRLENAGLYLVNANMDLLESLQAKEFDSTPMRMRVLNWIDNPRSFMEQAHYFAYILQKEAGGHITKWSRVREHMDWFFGPERSIGERHTTRPAYARSFIDVTLSPQYRPIFAKAYRNFLTTVSEQLLAADPFPEFRNIFNTVEKMERAA